MYSHFLGTPGSYFHSHTTMLPIDLEDLLRMNHISAACDNMSPSRLKDAFFLFRFLELLSALKSKDKSLCLKIEKERKMYRYIVFRKYKVLKKSTFQHWE